MLRLCVKWGRRLLLTVSAFAALGAARPQPAPADPVAVALDSQLAPKTGVMAPGFALSIRKDGESLFEVFSGAADLEGARPIDRETVFHIASLSKQITAAAVAFAILDGKIALDDPVSKWIPAVKKYGDSLQIAHLVYMTSGLREYYEVPRPGGQFWSTFDYFTIDDAIAASLSADRLEFSPGSAWRYSNINYMLLTRVVAAAYEKPFREVINDRVFAPLDMRASLVNDDPTEVIPLRADAYAPRTKAVIDDLAGSAGVKARAGTGWIQIRRNAPHYGGSGVMTSIADWSKWQDEMLSGAVFGEDFWRLMASTRAFSHAKVNDAFGLVHGDFKGRKTLWYEGGDIDTSSYSIAFPEFGVSVACFSNNPHDSCRDKAMKAVAILIEAGKL